jgi:hypothetical protein
MRMQMRMRMPVRSTVLQLGLALLAAGCGITTVVGPDPGGDDDGGGGGGSGSGGGSQDVPVVRLDSTPGRYRGPCDGSGGVALDFKYFLTLSDEDQVARVYARGAAGGPVQTFQLSSGLGVATNAEVDLEEAVRVGDRVYAISSHGRTNDGDLDPVRHRFVAIDLAGTAPSFSVSVAASRTRLLGDLLDASRWATPSQTILAALQASARPDLQSAPNLAPKVQGFNIEGLARAPLTGAPDRLMIGLRNPRPAGRAIAVSLLNPAELAGGSAARFGEATELDLGGLGLRGMAWSDAARAVLLLAGPYDGAAGPFRIYRWSGAPGAAPVLARELTVPANAHPEAIVTYPGTPDVQILYDSDDVILGGQTCKEGPAASREFGDLIVQAP